MEKKPADQDDDDAWEYWVGVGAQQYRRHRQTGRSEVRVGAGRQRRWDVVRQGSAMT
jgi:hypothetical protein